MNFYQFLVPRLAGADIEKNFDRYLGLARKGVAGFIVFGGEVETLREGLKRLQREAPMPLIIASDLEQGLGQQVNGGTLFPPAAAVAQAEKKSSGIARKAFECMAREAAYAGINTIFAPVLDVNTNPKNPIISTRAFSDEPGEVSALGETMIKALMENGVRPCGKHFPGHGSTAVDSHLVLPHVEKSLEELESCELRPFRRAVASGVPMIMLGHLSVPAIEPSGTPVSVSKAAVRFLRDEMGFQGIIITDAMDMGGLGSFSAGEASLMALEAGVDLLLHPAEPERLATELERSGKSFDAGRVETFRRNLPPESASGPPFQLCEALSLETTRDAIVVEGTLKPMKNPFVLVLSDEAEDGSKFVDALRARHPSLGHRLIAEDTESIEVPEGTDVIVAVFSKIKAFKGGSAPWMEKALHSIEGKISVAVSFGSPHLIASLEEGIPKIYAWWGTDAAQLEAAIIFII